MLKTLWRFISLGLKIVIGFSILATCIFCYAFTVVVVGFSNNNGYQAGVKESASIAPVTFGNPYLPYKDVTPQIFTGSRWHTKGTEVDYATPAGTPLYAPLICPCVVTSKGSDGYGNTYIRFSSEDRRNNILYMHGNYTVSPGDIIAPGTLIGTEAMNGNGDRPHTHIEVTKDGKNVDPRDFDNTTFIAETGTKQISHTDKRGNYGSVLQSYDDVVISMSHYDPSQGGINCDSDCSTMASGDKVADWILGKNGIWAAACPQEWPIGTRLRIDNITFECRDRGGWINCYNVGDYDPAYKRNSTVKHCWIDALGTFGYTYGQTVTNWGFIN